MVKGIGVDFVGGDAPVVVRSFCLLRFAFGSLYTADETKLDVQGWKTGVAHGRTATLNIKKRASTIQLQ
jgi:hypothetical protein